MKNLFEEKQKRKKWWDSLSSSDKFELLKTFTQVYGGEADDELEKLVSKKFINDGFPSTKFMEELLKLAKSGKPFMLTGHN